jgi:hypothetical protein
MDSSEQAKTKEIDPNLIRLIVQAKQLDRKLEKYPNLREKYISILLNNYGSFRKRHPDKFLKQEIDKSEFDNLNNIRSSDVSLAEKLNQKKTELDELKQKLNQPLSEKGKENFWTDNLPHKISEQMRQMWEFTKNNNFTKSLNEFEYLLQHFIESLSEEDSMFFGKCLVFLITKRELKSSSLDEIISNWYDLPWVRDIVAQGIERSTPALSWINENLNLVTPKNYVKAERDLLHQEILKKEEKIQQIDNEIIKLQALVGKQLADEEDSKRDKTASYVSGASDIRPRNYELVTKFSFLKTQTFQGLSDKLFKYFRSIDEAEAVNRRRRIAEIKSTLSRKILIESVVFFNENNELSGKSLTECVEDISNSIYQSLNINRSTITEELCNSIKDSVQKGLELVEDIDNADPPGKLCLMNGERFDSGRHEPVLGCEEGGTVEFTVYPAYFVGDRVFAKAVVFTSPEKAV